MLSIKVSENGGKAPAAVPYMPAGPSDICATVNGKPGRRTVFATREACERLQADLQEQLRASAAGEKARPMLMFDHRAGNAAAKPLGFEWDEKRGILLRVEWTQAGREAVEGGNYGYISPVFNLSRSTGEIIGLSGGVEVGSLVNDPAFERNECIAASRVEEPEQVTVEYIEAEKKGADVIPEPVPPRGQIENAPNSGHNELKPATCNKMDEQIKKTLGLPPDADEAAVLAAIRALKASGAEAVTKTETLSAECEQHKKALAEHKEKSADSFVKRLQKDGTIAPHDEERAKAARTLYMTDPEQAEVLFCGLTSKRANIYREEVKANRVPSSSGQVDNYESRTLEELLNDN